MKKDILLASIVLVIAIALGVILGIIGFGLISKSVQPDSVLRGNAFEATQFKTASSTSETITISVTTSARILATTTTDRTRIYARICNDSGTKVYFRMDGDKPVTNVAGEETGSPLAANTCYEINDQNSYQGSIQASSTNETASNLTIHSYEL